MRYFLLAAVLFGTGCGESHSPGDGVDSGTRRDSGGGMVSEAGITFPDGSTRRDGGPILVDGGPNPVDAGPGFDSGVELDLIAECVSVCRRAVSCGLSETVEGCASDCLDTERFITDPMCEQLLAATFSCVEGLDCRGIIQTFEGDSGPCRPLVDQFERECGEDGRPPMPVPG